MIEGSLETERLLKCDCSKDSTSSCDYSSVPSLSDSYTSEPIKVYRRRWYVLTVFAALNAVSMFYTNTFAPIQEPVKLLFHWEDWNILLFNALGFVSLIIVAPTFAWLANSKGLRPAVLLSAGLLFLGKALHTLPFIGRTIDTLLMYVGQIIYSLSFGVSLGVPTLVSAIWFPANERTTATAIGTLSPSIGMASGFLTAPLFVPYSNSKRHNGSTSNTSNYLLGDIRRHFKELMYLQAALGLVVLIAVLVYFPNKPPLPPSRSTTKKQHHQEPFKSSLIRMLRNGSFWVLASLFAVEFGVAFAWQSVLALLLSKFGIGQHTASLIGSGGSLAGIVSGLIVSRVADYYNHSTKTILILLFAGSTVLLTVFSLTCEGIITYNTPLVYATCISSFMFAVDANPLLFELAVEVTYPVPEVFSTVFLTLLSSGVSVIFFLVFLFPNMDVRWMNWVFVGSVASCVPGLLLFKAKYRRLDFDVDGHTHTTCNRPKQSAA